MRIFTGIGYDIHRLIENKPLIIGAVDIPFHKGFKAHSDGDVLIHAVIDALLGASRKGNIGLLYPDTDEKYKNISSSILLNKTVKLINEEYEIVNIDSTIICEKPKLNPYIPQMIKNLAEILKIDTDYISIKPKTAEGLGEIGNVNAIATFVTVLIEKL